MIYGELTPEDLAYHNSWHAASGHHKGWRVVRGIGPSEELNGKDGRLILFRTFRAAKVRADWLNSEELRLRNSPDTPTRKTTH